MKMHLIFLKSLWNFRKIVIEEARMTWIYIQQNCFSMLVEFAINLEDCINQKIFY